MAPSVRVGQGVGPHTGCSSTISLKGTELDPEPLTMGSIGTNHDGSSGKVQGWQGTVVQASALWCTQIRWTPVRRGGAKQGSAAGG